MIDLVVQEPDYLDEQQRLLSQDAEACAIAYMHWTTRKNGMVRLLVREWIWAEPSDYLSRSEVRAELSPAFVAHLTKAAARQNAALLFVHTHPGSQKPTFSLTDSRGEALVRSRFPEAVATVTSRTISSMLP